MPIVVGIDLGSTKISCVALDATTGQILFAESAPNRTHITHADQEALGYSEWDADGILQIAHQCLARLTQKLGTRVDEVAGIGTTGQQHGVVLVSPSDRTVLSPFVTWQDRRALLPMNPGQPSWLEAARQAIGPDAWRTAGCSLQPGYMGVTLFEWQRRGQLPAHALALFIMDYFVADLSEATPVTEPSCAASSGLFDVRGRNWDATAISALGLPLELFPRVCEAHTRVGHISRRAAERTGLPAGIPTFAAIGDHQASFLGSVTDRHRSVLVNVGTGAQIAVYSDDSRFELPVELRPFPCGGNLLTIIDPTGGWSYQVLERFFQSCGVSLFQSASSERLYSRMNQLAESVPSGCDGLRCDPVFAGTRQDAARRGAISGLAPQNFTPGHLARAVLEGMAQSFWDSFQEIGKNTVTQPTQLVAAGNGLRENPLLAEIVASTFNLPVVFTEQREEAARGAAVIAAVGAGLYSTVDEAARRLVRTK